MVMFWLVSPDLRTQLKASSPVGARTQEGPDMRDPTYVQDVIDADPVMELAFTLSEIENDTAPLGWSKYIPTARCLLDNYTITRKPK